MSTREELIRQGTTTCGAEARERSDFLARLSSASSIASAQAIALEQVQPGGAPTPWQANLLRFLAGFTSQQSGFRIDPKPPALPASLTGEERQAYVTFAKRLAAAGQLSFDDSQLVERLLQATSGS